MIGFSAAFPIEDHAPERGLDAPIRILSLAGADGDGDGDGLGEGDGAGDGEGDGEGDGAGDGDGDGDGDGSASPQAPISNGATNIEIRQIPINSANSVFFK
jgi:hypothetical protein